MIRPFTLSDLPAVIAVWNEAVEAGEVVYYPITEDYFHKKQRLLAFAENRGINKDINSICCKAVQRLCSMSFD